MNVCNPIHFEDDDHQYILADEHFDVVMFGFCRECKKEIKHHTEEYNDPLGYECFNRYAEDNGYCLECTLKHKHNDTGKLFTSLINAQREMPVKVEEHGDEHKAYFSDGTNEIFYTFPTKVKAEI